MFVDPEDWKPVGIADLEPAAWKALRSTSSTCVVAGPGAGKTEFLAQRAAYLLQTGACPPPYRILAISFKRDAATNLAERVRRRCAPELAARFSSMTFDAFCKGLVDRFQMAIPKLWRPTRPYNIGFAARAEIEEFLQRSRGAAKATWQSEIMGINPSAFLAETVGGWKLPTTDVPPASGTAFAVKRWWTENLTRDPASTLDFTLINRLAELLQRASPQIGEALRATYPIVFVDEFQDTTFAQYDLLQSAFGGSRTVVTAVGDDKQRIMGWAGARSDAFATFETDFGATRIPLRFNYRSSPDLVKIQQVVAQALDEDSAEIESRAESTIDDDVAQVWTFDRLTDEAEQVAAWIAEDMKTRGKVPRDYAILVRQTADRFEDQLKTAFQGVDLGIRNESKAIGDTNLQDLLVEEAVKIAVAVLRLAAAKRAPKAWAVASDAIQLLRGIDQEDEVGAQSVEDELRSFVKTLRFQMSGAEPCVETAKVVSKQLFEFLGQDAFARVFLTYSTGEGLAIAIDGFRRYLATCCKEAGTWQEALDAFEGLNDVPLMTVHKSKGLEYDTIIFMGLDDRMWWSFSPTNPEGRATFFVALSRAKQRAIFTFCRERGQRNKIAELYKLLSDAGVQETAF